MTRKERILEELSQADKSAAKKYVIDSRDLEDKIAKIVKEKLKNNREMDDQVVQITKNVLTQLFKALWVKRNFWSSGLSNKPT
tara:strand:- start:1808 stop:2056 length:249 start_codon:yes stop_codon:yes gene_type:complete